MSISFGSQINKDVSLSNCFGEYDIPDLIAEINISDTLDNGQTSILHHSVPGLYAGSNYNIQLATDITALTGIEIQWSIVADDTLQTIIKNNSGQDGVTIPALTFNIYKL